VLSTQERERERDELEFFQVLPYSRTYHSVVTNLRDGVCRSAACSDGGSCQEPQGEGHAGLGLQMAKQRSRFFEGHVVAVAVEDQGLDCFCDVDLRRR